VVTATSVVSVQVGRARDHGTRGAADLMDRPWRSGIFKDPVQGRVRLGELGFDGDEQADLVNHGGPDKAALLYSADHFIAWGDVLGDVPPGGFGENLSVTGLDETTVCVGDRHRIGDALVECTQPRQPCWKLDRKWRRRDLGARVIESGRSGWYVRVIQPGAIGAGDAIELIARPNPGWPIARAGRIMHRMDDDASAAVELAHLPQLASSWRELLLARSR
jgi:MOSC domain-containing protein YiiM